MENATVVICSEFALIALLANFCYRTVLLQSRGDTKLKLKEEVKQGWGVRCERTMIRVRSSRIDGGGLTGKGGFLRSTPGEKLGCMENFNGR